MECQNRVLDEAINAMTKVVRRLLDEQSWLAQEGAPQCFSCLEYGHEVSTYPEHEWEMSWGKHEVIKGLEEPKEKTQSVHDCQQPPEELLREEKMEQLFLMPDSRCKEEVGGDLQQPEGVLLERGKEPLQQQIQTRDKDDSQEAKKQRLEEQIRLVECGTVFLSHLLEDETVSLPKSTTYPRTSDNSTQCVRPATSTRGAIEGEANPPKSQNRKSYLPKSQYRKDHPEC
ncbi:UNVERIFIED_CONTAM: hypothetical protein FKN15_034437 [Acipenser sinensis]